MSLEQVTILIPDISGYTEFVSKTEIDHGTHILNHLLETIVHSIGEDFVVSEIEGDAVLLYKKGNPPTKKEIIEQCVKTFTAFHTQLQGMDSIRICQCVACSGFIKLTLKFVVHFGTIAENTVSRFVKASGIDMIIAHRLLKNNINCSEYLLMTKNYLSNIPDADETLNLFWSPSQEEYSSIGMVEFDFAPLESIRKLVPEKLKKEAAIPYDHALPLEIEVNANYKDVFAALIDVASRKYYLADVRDVEHKLPMAIIGMKHYCIFEGFNMEVEPMSIEIRENEISYREYQRIPQMNLYSVIHFTVVDLGDNRCKYVVQIGPEEGYHLIGEQRKILYQMHQETMKNLKMFAENGFQLETKLEAS